MLTSGSWISREEIQCGSINVTTFDFLLFLLFKCYLVIVMNMYFNYLQIITVNNEDKAKKGRERRS